MINKIAELGSVDVPNKHILDFRWQERKVHYLTFGFGRRLPFDSGNPNLSFTLLDPKDYDLIYHSDMTEEILLKRYESVRNNGTSPIVNKRFMDLLNELCPDDVQFFPATIVSAHDKMEPFENHDYYVLNICRKIDALDMEKTEFELYDKSKPMSDPYNVDIAHTTPLFYKTVEQIEPFGIGRLLYKSPRIILSPTVAEAVKEAKIKGLRLYPCS